jgi:hypothetical protein
MWTETYKQHVSALEQADDDVAVKQLDECRDHLPELHAAVSLLSLALEDAVMQLEGANGDGTAELMLPRLPAAVLRLAQRSPLVISRDEYCRILERVAARQHFRALARGEVREPSAGCAPR